MNKLVASFTLFIGFATQAEPIEPCNNLVYRAVEDPKSQTTRLFCFCKQDFDRLLKRDVTDQEHMLNKMEWQQILADTGYTDTQLRALVKR